MNSEYPQRQSAMPSLSYVTEQSASASASPGPGPGPGPAQCSKQQKTSNVTPIIHSTRTATGKAVKD